MVFLAALSLVAATQQAPSTAAGKPADSDSQLVCKRLSRTGSRMAPKRICLPAFEWRQTELRAQRDVGAIKERSQMEQVPSF